MFGSVPRPGVESWWSPVDGCMGYCLGFGLERDRLGHGGSSPARRGQVPVDKLAGAPAPVMVILNLFVGGRAYAATRREFSGVKRRVSVGDWYANRAHRHDRDPGFDPVNDDVRDPFEFGAVQETRGSGDMRRARGFASGGTRSGTSGIAGKRRSTEARARATSKKLTVEQRRRWESFAKNWFAMNEGGPARKCWDAAQAAGLVYVTEAMAAEQRAWATRTWRPRPVDPARRARSSPEAVVADIVRINPVASLGTYQQALLDAGHPLLDKAAIEAIFRQLAARDRGFAEKPQSTPVSATKIRRSKRSTKAKTAYVRSLKSTVVVAEQDRCPSCDVVPDKISGACRCG